ncbi:uncharacterized protein [Anabrus simplex]|uniref:uncharacterized protein n=1 Tax=Anabrus simplex TaxID=316456 RepID=UPI0035A2F626
MVEGIGMVLTVLTMIVTSLNGLEVERLPGDCPGDVWLNSTLSAYYPDYNEVIDEDSYLDLRGMKVSTFQELLDDRSQFATVALDKSVGLKYGTPVCVPELEVHYGRPLSLEVRDSGSNLDGKGFSQMDICVRSEADSYDHIVNRPATLVFYSRDLLEATGL